MAKTFVNNPALNAKLATRTIVDGIIVVNATKPEFGSIMFEQKVLTLGEGFTNAKKRTHFQSGEIATLQELAQELNLQAGKPVEGYHIALKEYFSDSADDKTPAVERQYEDFGTYSICGTIDNGNFLSMRRKSTLVEIAKVTSDVTVSHTHEMAEDGTILLKEEMLDYIKANYQPVQAPPVDATVDATVKGTVI